MAEHTPAPWVHDTDGAITPQNIDADSEWRPQLEGVIDFDPTGGFDGGLYGFQVSSAAGRGIAIVEWHGDVHDEEDRANLALILAAPRLLAALQQVYDDWQRTTTGHVVKGTIQHWTEAHAALVAARREAGK